MIIAMLPIASFWQNTISISNQVYDINNRSTLTVQQVDNTVSQNLNQLNNKSLDHDSALLLNRNDIASNDVEQPLPDPDLPVVNPEDFVYSSDLIINAINPGYTDKDGTRDVGELIELRRTTPHTLSLAGYSVRYTNSSGNTTTLIDFSEGTELAGETLLMRLARTSSDEDTDLTYSTTLSMSNGAIELYYNDTVMDSVCWSDKKSSPCLEAFTSNNPTTLVRLENSNIFEHLLVYVPSYDPSQPNLIFPPEPSVPENPNEPADDSTSQTTCYGLEITEIFTYYANDKSEQFLELHNPTNETISLDSCSLRYKKKTYALSGAILSDSYFIFSPQTAEVPFTFTKNPTSTNTIELIDSNGRVIDLITYPHGQKKNASFAKFYDTKGEENWQTTYAITPATQNVYQEYQTCETGKTINPATGNCVKVTSTASAQTDCPAGKYRNPLTGRCKNIDSSSTELKPCAEGYERNPETNRCRKITSTNDGAGYALVPNTYSDKKSFVAFGIVLILITCGVIYIIFQYRHELMRLARKIRQRFYYILEYLIARCARSDRHKKP